MGKPYSLPKGHPMNALALQIAIALPLAIPVVLAAALLIGPGLLIGLYLPAPISLGGWLTAALLLLFAFLGRRAARSTR
jgi:hypothetical protein